MKLLMGQDTLGNTKATSSNLPRLLQFSAIGDLETIRELSFKMWRICTILPHCLNQ